MKLLKIFIYGIVLLHLTAAPMFALESNNQNFNSQLTLYDQDDSSLWIYYASLIDNKKLYKIRLDRTDRTKLCDDVVGKVQELNGWVYYTNISDNCRLYRISIDGANKEKICDDKVENFELVNSNIYYVTRNNDEWSINKMNIVGSEKTMVANCVQPIFKVAGDWIYYCFNTASFLGGNIYKVRTDGTEKTKIYDGMCNGTYMPDSLMVEASWVYFVDSDGLKRIKTDGKDLETIINYTVSLLYVKDSWIYYCDSNLNKVDTSGQNKTTLKYNSSSMYTHLLQIVADWIIYYDVSDEYVIRMIKKDGTQKQALEILDESATLKDLKIDGKTIQGFTTNEHYYIVYLPYETTNLPKVTAEPFNPLAHVEIISATKLPGQTEIFVCTEDEIIQYTVVFKIPTMNDLVTIAMIYGKKINDMGYDNKMDLNKDGLIDLYDLVIIGKKMITNSY